MGNNPSGFKDCGANCPVEQVSWDDAQAFVRRLSQATGKAYRLPSEAEWEYSCRAGYRHEYCGSDVVDEVAWVTKPSATDRRTRPVAGKRPNGWGLYDMSGNVWEWTEDCWNDNYNGAPADARPWLKGDCAKRVYRGGGYILYSENSRSAKRQAVTKTGFVIDFIGFRVAATLP